MIFLSLLANLGLQMADNSNLSVNASFNLEILNFLYFIICSAEIIIKITSFGGKAFLSVTDFHTFDSFNVVFSLVDAVIIFGILKPEERLISNSMTIIRSFRILRFFKLAQYWRNFEVLNETLVMTMKKTGSFVILLLVMMFIYILMGIEFFAHKAHLDEFTGKINAAHGESPHLNFDNFLNSFMAVYMILINDLQSMIFYNFYRSVSP